MSDSMRDTGDKTSTILLTKSERRLVALEAAAQDFIDKVERGDARSTRSYAKFKEAMAIRD